MQIAPVAERSEASIAACLCLSVAVIWLGYGNQRIQTELQTRQAQAEAQGSALTPQGQQVVGTILQDMAAVAATNAPMKALLGKYGPALQTPQPGMPTSVAQPATNAAPDAMQETAT